MASSATSAGSRISIRVRAALAGGLVFGIATGRTVASWTDAEYAASTFTASRFDIETSLNGGGAYASTSSVPIAVGGVYPGPAGAVYQGILIRTVTPSIAGTVTFRHPAIASAGTLAAVLRYRAVQTTATCASGVFTAGATYLVGSSSAYASVGTPVTVPVAAGSVAADSASTTGVCLEFSLPATGVAQGTYAGTSSGAMSFLITGTSS